MIITGLTAAILAALATTAAATAGTAAVKGGIDSKESKTTPTRRTGGWYDFERFFNNDVDTSDADLGRWFKQQYGSNEYLDSLNDATLGALLQPYWNKATGPSFAKEQTFDYDSAVKDLNELLNAEGVDIPKAPDYSSIYQNALADVNAENDELLALLDQNLNRQISSYDNIYGQGISDLNKSYNDYAKQILSTDYMKNAQLVNSYQSEMSRSRQNALEAGASAGLRLASNINTVMSMQNKQTQQSLDTANNLAQQMLNQRQAAMGLRSDYTNATNNAYGQDTASRIDIKQGSLERAENYANSRFNTQRNIYDNAMANRDTYYNTAFGDNPFVGSYSGFLQGQSYKDRNKNY